MELEGLDLAEFGQDFYPEFERVPEVIVEPDGREVEAGPVLLEAYWQTNGKAAGGAGVGAEERSEAMFDAFPYDEWSEEIADFWTSGGQTRPGRTSRSRSGSCSWSSRFVGCVRMENGKLERQAGMLRQAGAGAPRTRPADPA